MNAVPLSALATLVVVGFLLGCTGAPPDETRCGEGTVLEDGVCRPMPASACGSDTVWDEVLGRCVAESGLCGPGTIWDEAAEACVAASEVCGAGTRWDAGARACEAGEGACAESTEWDAEQRRCRASAGVCGAHTSWDEELEQCALEGDICGTGTSWDDDTGRCAASAAVCGESTEWDGELAQCRASDAVCGEGTSWDEGSGRCLPHDSVCGDGTGWDDASGRCVPTSDVCGEGTIWDGASGRCVPASDVCGEGTSWDAASERCLPSSDVCGTGTAWDETTRRCVFADDICGVGAVWDAGLEQCVVDPSVCGPGTVWSHDRELCVLTSEACGGATYFHPVIEQCVVGHVFVGSCSSPTTIGGQINESTILASGGCFRVTSNLTVRNGAHLTIQDGVTLAFDNDVHLDVNNGTLDAQGTAAEPILLTGVAPMPGYWRGVRFTNSTSVLNRLDHVIVEYARAGWGSEDGGLVVSTGAGSVQLAIENSTFRHNVGPGLVVEPTYIGRTATLSSCSANTFADNDGAAALFAVQQIGACDGTSAFAGGNTRDVVEVLGGTALGDQTIAALDVPYRVRETITFNSGTFVIEAGAVLEFATNAGLIAGGNAATTWIVSGTPAAPVRMTGVESVRGYWRGVRLSNGLSTEALVEHLVIEYAGSSDYNGDPTAGLTINAHGGPVAARLRNVTSRHNDGYGVYLAPNYIGRTSTLALFEENVLTENSAGPISVASVRIPLLDEETVYSGNDIDLVDVRISNVTADAVWPGLDVPYRLDGGFIVRDDAVLTLSPGVRIQFASGAGMSVGTLLSDGTLVAEGTAARPIELYGEVPLPGFWQGLRFTRSTSVLNALEHMTIRHGGSSAWANAEAANLTLSTNNGPVRVQLRDVHLADGLGAGVYVDATVDISDCSGVTFSNVDPPIAGTDATWYMACP